MLNLKMSQNKSDPLQRPPHQLPPNSAFAALVLLCVTAGTNDQYDY